MRARLFIGIMHSSDKLYSEILENLKQEFGKILVESEPYDFDFTDYYEKEFGGCLKKRFVVFERMIAREKLASIKLFTNELEKIYSVDGKRKVNLDPGYFTKDNLVLASTKERSHRIYLSDGIFAEVTFVFSKDKCLTYNHTYPDFKTKEVQDFFLKLGKDL